MEDAHDTRSEADEWENTNTAQKLAEAGEKVHSTIRALATTVRKAWTLPVQPASVAAVFRFLLLMSHAAPVPSKASHRPETSDQAATTIDVQHFTRHVRVGHQHEHRPRHIVCRTNPFDGQALRSIL